LAIIVVALMAGETEAQVVELRRLGCRLGQGFLFARPLEPQALEGLLAARPAA